MANWLSFTSGLLQGGVKGYQMRRDWDRQDEMDALTKQERGLNIDKMKRAAADEAELRRAGSLGDEAPLAEDVTPTVVAPEQDATVGQRVASAIQSQPPSLWNGPDTPASGDASQPPTATGSLVPGLTMPATPNQPSERERILQRFDGAAPADGQAQQVNPPPSPVLAGIQQGQQAAQAGVEQGLNTARYGDDEKRMRIYRNLEQAYLNQGNPEAANRVRQTYKNLRDENLSQGDMEYANTIMANPNGDKAKKFLGLLGKHNVSGLNLQTDPKTGLSFIQMNTPGGEPRTIELSGSDLGKMAIAYRKLMRNDVSGLDLIASVDKGLAGTLAGDWKAKMEMAKFNNATAVQGANIAHQNKSLGIQAAHLALSKNKNAALANYGKSVGASDAQIAALQAGVSPGDVGLKIGGDQPMQVKLAQYILKTGAAKNEKEAIQIALQRANDSPDQMRQKIYSDNKKLGLEHEENVKSTDAAMKYLFPSTDASSDGTATGGSNAALPSVGEVRSGYRFKGGNPAKQINWEKL